MKVRASIENINAFSAHADYGNVRMLNSIDTSRLKKIFLVHGEPDAQNAFKSSLMKTVFQIQRL